MKEYRKTPKNREYMKEYFKSYYKREYAKVAKNTQQRSYREIHGYPKTQSFNATCANLKRNYGLSFTQYDNMRKEQDYKCAICGTKESCLDRQLSVDHDHITKKIRGLLCRKCNSAIGYLHDDARLVEKALRYLEKEWK
jgi:DNA-directed RNA polymerase subunit RPC12/RpoP